MKLAVAVGIAFSLLFGVVAFQGDKEALQGTWKLVSGEVSGEVLSEQQLQGGKLVLKGDQYTATLPGMDPITGTQKLDSTGKIKTIDITDTTGPNKGKTCLGIYELEGDQFRVTFALPGKSRPTKMSTLPESGSWSHVWQRVTE